MRVRVEQDAVAGFRVASPCWVACAALQLLRYLGKCVCVWVWAALGRRGGDGWWTKANETHAASSPCRGLACHPGVGGIAASRLQDHALRMVAVAPTNIAPEGTLRAVVHCLPDLAPHAKST